MRLMTLDRGDVVIRRQAVESALQEVERDLPPRARDELSRAIYKIFRDAVVKSARYVIFGKFEHGEPVPLPTDRTRYKDKHNFPNLAKLNPLEFYEAVYCDLPKDGVVYANELGKVDAWLLKAMRNYCRNHDIDLSVYVKPRSAKPSLAEIQSAARLAQAPSSSPARPQRTAMTARKRPVRRSSHDPV
jgi:hypothetical protein